MIKKIILLMFAFCIVYHTNLMAQYEEVPARQTFRKFKPIDLIDLPTGNTLIEDNRGLGRPQCFHLYMKFSKIVKYFF